VGEGWIVMHPRARQLIEQLELEPHPEGGHYRRVYRSLTQASVADGRGERATMTSIVYLLTVGEISRWHRVLSDEAWHFHEGAPLALMSASPDFAHLHRHRLGPVDGTHASPLHVVPANHWQAARSTGDYTLVGCTVAPGFDFADFVMLRERPEDAARLAQLHPELEDLI
jgi:predicted cupin superfamily sugar epimerase